jgi:uncharacterized protein YgbK (DUF1537 family)
MKPILGCIADDYTGATDIASMLREGGMRVIQYLGIPKRINTVNADAIIIALKSRSISKSEAIKESLEALKWLEASGCKQYYFKYCSTFDSTNEGNIGPVIEAIMIALESEFTIACPAYPENGRTIYNGYLFVGQKLLSESGMQNHPLNPMTDSNLVNVLQKQTNLKVGLLNNQWSRNGYRKDEVNKLIESGVKVAITDAIVDTDLIGLIEVFGDLKLLTGGSGLALGLPNYYRFKGYISSNNESFSVKRIDGYAAVISGSCSEMTLKQITRMKQTHASFKLDMDLILKKDQFEEFIKELIDQLGEKPILVYSSEEPDKVKEHQLALGANKAGRTIEEALTKVATKIVEKGVSKLVVAGGETSGAIVKALGLKALKIGQVIAPGVPWTQTLKGKPLALALKSGNFGDEDFFIKAFKKLE